MVLNIAQRRIFCHKGQNNKADNYFLKAIQSGNKEGSKSDLSYAHQEYSKFLLKSGDYKKAYERIWIPTNKITEELYNEEKLKKADARIAS